MLTKWNKLTSISSIFLKSHLVADPDDAAAVIRSKSLEQSKLAARGMWNKFSYALKEYPYLIAIYIPEIQIQLPDNSAPDVCKH